MTKLITDNSSFVLDITKIQRTVKIQGVSFEEEFLSKLIKDHFSKQPISREPTITDAFNIYIRESPSAKDFRFRITAERNFNTFKSLWGDLRLSDLRHWHITQYRDYLLRKNLKTATVRKHHNTLNAMLNVAFRHLDIDRLSPFRALKILNENEDRRVLPIVTTDTLKEIKQYLLKRTSAAHALVALLQLNTGFRISEPVFSKLADCVLDHDIPHLWIRKTNLSDRKNRSSIRAVPLYGVSLFAATELVRRAKAKRSEWLVPEYARYNGNTSCSAIVNKTLRMFDFRSHMFRHAIIDRMKACNDIPTHLAESITGHSSGKSHFHIYGTVGYTLEQKFEVIKRVAI